MKLANVKTTDVSFNDYRKQLRKQGYRKLGSGLYAEVYGKKGVNHVFKIGRLETVWHEDGYIGFLRHIDPSNPMFPKIKSVERFNVLKKNVVQSRYYAVKMERLIEYESVKWEVCQKVFNRMGIESFYDFEDPPKYAPTFKSKFAARAHKILHKLWDKYHDDLHDGNVMWRKKEGGKYQLVITDPATKKYTYYR